MEADFGRKEYIVGGIVTVVVIGGVALAATSGGNKAPGSTNKSGGDYDWRTVELKDVNSGAKYTISELDKPVLLETFAVWCPTCTRQQQEVKKLHEETGISSVSLDVDPNEDATKVRKHAQRHGFNWRYSIADARLTQALVEEFGGSMRVPPRAPMVLVCENGARKLPDGVKPVSKLKEEVKKGC